MSQFEPQDDLLASTNSTIRIEPLQHQTVAFSEISETPLVEIAESESFPVETTVMRSILDQLDSDKSNDLSTHSQKSAWSAQKQTQEHVRRAYNRLVHRRVPQSLIPPHKGLKTAKEEQQQKQTN
ncbi:hypothetical protein niasHS_004366 [Heterodera schachtii]|uniref:Uncharacterized protein n=1 Tax=Heterodera schachtii TaxID=97005 RepID=A0ABD2K0W6_HETSC